MSTPRYPLFTRLPEIHRIRDQEQMPPDEAGNFGTERFRGPLERFLGLVETAFGHVHDNIAALYDDHFIETCADWVIPYIGDLVGTSHLSGDPRTLRADVADTVALRRRKGTLAAIELLTYALSRWGVHAVELRERLVWNQHLNHQRPDMGGDPPYGLPPGTPAGVVARQPRTLSRAIRGGTVTLRDPASLTLIDGPFDPFAHVADVRPPVADGIRYNLPNLAIFLWRLTAYRVPAMRPLLQSIAPNAAAVGSEAPLIVRFFVHPMREPVRLFNTYRFDPEQRPIVVSTLDETPSPIPAPRLTTGAPMGNPTAYLAVHSYNEAVQPPALTLSDHGLQLHVPAAALGGAAWSFLGANLCAWETGLERPLQNFEIAIDPVIGRIAIGVPNAAAANALDASLLLTYTYGAVGPIGAHPDDERGPPPTEWAGEPVDLRLVTFDPLVNTLQQQLANIENSPRPIVIEITDSRTYDLDIGAVAGTVVEGGGPNLRLHRSLVIRARGGQRPVVRLTAPLRFRPTNVANAAPPVQAQLDAVMARLAVRLEGLYLTRSDALIAADANAPLIARAALNKLELVSCTLDPAGFRRPNGTREVIRQSLDLRDGFGFAAGTAEDLAFAQTPDIVVQRSITGPLRIDDTYTLTLVDSVVDGGRGVADAPGVAFALASATDPVNGWGPPTSVSGATLFGRTRAASLRGCGGIFVHALEVQDTQHGCIKQSYFSGGRFAGFDDHLPQHFACVTGADAVLGFVAHAFGAPGYAQLTRGTDFRIRERGPNDDAMGATGFLLEAHKWRNLQIRYREFVPVGVRALLIPVT